MDENLYVVTQEGVYRHGIFGVFTDKNKAIALAYKLAETDSDDYHEYLVIPFKNDAEIKRSRGFMDSHKAKEQEAIFSARKGQI